jgi:hypothetical protein
MNYAKIAAALHALADAFEEGGTDSAAPEQPPKRSRRTTAEAPTAAATTTAAVAATPAASPASAAPASVAPAAAPALTGPTITKAKLNEAVLKVASTSRDTAKAILVRFGVQNTVALPEDKWQAVFDACEEEIAKIDAAAVKVAQESLV